MYNMFEKQGFIEKEKSFKKRNFIKDHYANLIFKTDDECIILKGG